MNGGFTMSIARRKSVVSVNYPFYLALLRGIFLMFLFSLIGIFIVASIAFFTDFVLELQENQIIFNVIMGLSIFFAAFLSSYKAKRGGFLLGLLLGLLYALLSYQLGAMFFGGNSELIIPYGKVFICLLAGSAGGIIGVNI